MDELLNGLFESEVLTEDTRQQIKEALQEHFQTITEQAEQDAETRIRAELTEQFVEERNTLIEAVDAKMMEMLEGELEELKTDIHNFRNLEIEYAGKLVQEKEVMTEQLKQDMSTLLHSIDSFLEERLQVEFEELKEDIEEAKKDRWGRKLFEAFAEDFSVRFVDEDSLQAKLHEATEQLGDLQTQLSESIDQTNSLVRDNQMTHLLEPLRGRQREVMETLLKTIETDKLEETYNKFIDRIINESVNPKGSEKENEVLAEGDEQTPAEENGKDRLSEQVIIKDGNKEKTVNESLSDEALKLSDSERAALRRLSGQQ